MGPFLPFDVEGEDLVNTRERDRQTDRLAVLVDRGGRELPIEAACAAARIALPATQKLTLARDDAGRFAFAVKEQGA